VGVIGVLDEERARSGGNRDEMMGRERVEQRR